MVLLASLLMLSAMPDGAARCGIDDNVRWYEDSDYPVDARARGDQGVVVYRLQVDAEGCATACEIVRGSGHAAFDALTCPLLMKRARFDPARDAEGAPIASSYTGARWWMIPEPVAKGFTAPVPRGRMSSWVTNDDYPAAALRAEQEGNVGFRLQVDATGRAASCTVVMSSGSALLDTTTCSLMMRRSRFEPARDPAGNAVPGVYTYGIIWVVPVS